MAIQIERTDPLRDELLAAIDSWGVTLPPDYADDGPLLTTGLFDSLAIFNLVLWVEAKTGRKLEPSKTNILKEWNSVSAILAYVQDGSKLDIAAPALHSATEAAARNTAVRIIKYDPSFKSQIAALQVRLWSPSPDLNARYFEWKYERNPYIEKPILYLAVRGDELIGMRGFYGSLWELGLDAKQHVIPVADDLVVHDHYRNQGIVSQLMNYALQDLSSSEFSHVFNLSGSPITVLGSLTMGWRATHALEFLGRRKLRNSLRHQVQNLMRRTPLLWRYAAAKWCNPTRLPFAYLDQHKGKQAACGMNIEIATEPAAAAMAALVEKIGHDGRLRHVRNKNFFDWKFKNPLHEYRYLYSGGEQLTGYLILRASNLAAPGLGGVSLVDLESVNTDVARKLFRAAIHFGNFDELTLWGATFGSSIRDEMHAKGFVRKDEKKASVGAPCILVRPNSVSDQWSLDDKDLLDLDQWDMRMLYTMAG